jgi:hypothetical protein
VHCPTHFLPTPPWAELFKWLAEYTRRTPWCYFFLEDTNISWLYPENIDRVVINPTSQFRSSGGSGEASLSSSDFGMRAVIKAFDEVKDPFLTYLAYPARGAQSRSKLCKDFVSVFGRHFRAAVAEAQSPSILLSGAPGIGKTHFMKDFRQLQVSVVGSEESAGASAAAGSTREEAGCEEAKYPEPGSPRGMPPGVKFKFVDPDVDGSDDIFTRVALRDVLQKRAEACIVGANVKRVLIVDEVGGDLCGAVCYYYFFVFLCNYLMLSPSQLHVPSI